MHLKTILCILLVLTILVGCNAQPTETSTESTTVPEITQSPEEEKVTKILILGNSHSGDTFWQLQKVFQTELPDEQFAFGYLYYSGCPIKKHVEFAYSNAPEYIYRINADGYWTEYKDATMQMALKDQVWDYIVLQPGRADADDTYALDARRKLESYVAEYVKQPYQLLWQTTWANPTDKVFFSPEWPVQPPAGTEDTLIRLYGHNNVTQFTKSTDIAKQHIIPDDTYAKKMCIGSAIMHAILVQDRPQTEIYRDYTHLTDFGRLIASYSFFAQFTGQKITEVNVDVVPAYLRMSRYQSEGDLIITDEMKQILMDAVNYSVDNPWTVPAK